MSVPIAMLFQIQPGAMPVLLAASAEPLQAPQVLDADLRSKLLELLRRHGTAVRLPVRLAARLGIYSRGQDVTVFRISVRSGETLRTFGRLAAQHRELYFWAVRPDKDVDYVFATDWQFKPLGAGVELREGDMSTLARERSNSMFEKLMNDWAVVLRAM